MIQVKCPSGHEFAVAEHFGGSRQPCPRCGRYAYVGEVDRPAVAGNQAPAPNLPQTAGDRAAEIIDHLGHGDHLLRSAMRAAAAATDKTGAPLPAAVSRPSWQLGSQVVSFFTATPGKLAERTLHWLSASSGRVSRLSAARQRTAFWLTLWLVVLCLLALIPAMGHLNFATAPPWARILLLMALAQFAYTMLMRIVPDWSTVWVAMIVFALAAAMYGMGLAIALTTPGDRELALGLTFSRVAVAAWCAALVSLTSAAAYVCGWISYRWRRARSLR